VAVDPNGSNGFGDRLFWTAIIPGSDVQVEFGAGKAQMHVRSLATLDYPSLPISVGSQWQTSFVPATISFDVAWKGPVTDRINIRNGSNSDQFAGEFMDDEATVSWSASNATGFSFRSNAGTFATSVKAFAELGHERNGIFFRSDSSTALGANTQPVGIVDASPASPAIPPTIPLSNVLLDAASVDWFFAATAKDDRAVLSVVHSVKAHEMELTPDIGFLEEDLL
jgi:hypothetical protein